MIFDSYKSPLESLRRPSLLMSFVLAIWIGLGTTAGGEEPPLYRRYRFIQDVLLSENRYTSEKECRRFVDSPSVALVWRSEHKKEFDDAVSAINGALTPTGFSLRSMPPDSAEVRIKCFLASDHADYVRIRGWYALKGSTPADDWIWEMSWDPSSRLTKGYVVVNIAGCSNDVIRYRLIRGLLGALGLDGWSSAEHDSIFSGEQQSLTAIDRHLISFFYSHVRPGADAAELRKSFDQFWTK